MNDTTRALLDRAELDEVMNRYAASIDLRDWLRLRTAFADGEIEADFTSMGVKQVFRGHAEGWVDAVRQTITGFDATQHFFANHSAEVDSNRAVDTRYMQRATSSAPSTTRSAATTPATWSGRRRGGGSPGIR